MPIAGAPVSHRTAAVLLVLLSLVAAAAAGAVEALQPRSLLPWVCLAALAIAWTFRRPRAVDLFEPFAFLSWTHYAPAYVVGALLLALGIVGYPYWGLVPNHVAACTLALLYIVVGYLAFGVGCTSRVAGLLGHRLAALLPARTGQRTIPLGAICLLVTLGLVASYGAFRSGIIGFALPRAPGPFDAAGAYATTLLSLGHFLFWFRWFDPRQERLPRWTLLLPLLIVGCSMMLWGNRGVLLSCYLVAAFAYRCARGRLSLAGNTVVVALAFAALFLGMVYGSVFRRLKGGETGSPQAAVAAVATPAPSAMAAAPVAPTSRTAATPAGPPPASPSASAPVPSAPTPAPAPQSLERQVAVTAAAVSTMATFVRQPRLDRITAILGGLGDRLNLLSDVSVTIARYPSLRPLEASHGVPDLWTTTWSGFVPRVLWPNKPRVSDARAYAALYFGWDGNSFATSPVADLIRNVGPPLMPLGMALLGLVLGSLRAALVAGDAPPTAEGAALYSLLLLSVNLEGSYGLLLPIMLRVGFVAALGLGLVRLWRFLAGAGGAIGENRPTGVPAP